MLQTAMLQVRDRNTLISIRFLPLSRSPSHHSRRILCQRTGRVDLRRVPSLPPERRGPGSNDRLARYLPGDAASAALPWLSLRTERGAAGRARPPRAVRHSTHSL